MKVGKFKLIIVTCVLGLMASCTTNNDVENKRTTNIIDSVKAIETGVDFVFKTKRFADDYYVNPLKIVKSKNVPDNTVFLANGLKTELVNEKPNSEILNNWKNPQPYLEVLELKNVDHDRILLTLLFRTTGNEFAIWLKKGQSKCLEVDSLSHSKI